MSKRRKPAGLFASVIDHKPEWFEAAISRQMIVKVLELDGASFGAVGISPQLLSKAMEAVVLKNIVAPLADSGEASQERLDSWQKSFAKASRLVEFTTGIMARAAVALLHDQMIDLAFSTLRLISECSNPKCRRAYVPTIDRERLFKPSRRPPLYCSTKCQQARDRNRAEDAARYRKRRQAEKRELLKALDVPSLQSISLRPEDHQRVRDVVRNRPRAKKMLKAEATRRKAKSAARYPEIQAEAATKKG